MAEVHTWIVERSVSAQRRVVGDRTPRICLRFVAPFTVFPKVTCVHVLRFLVGASRVFERCPRMLIRLQAAHRLRIMQPLWQRRI
jgi:hypothetical protein